MKKIIVYLMLLSCISFLYFCSCEKKEPPISPVPDEIMQKVISELELNNDFSGDTYRSDSESQKLSEERANELYAGQEKDKQIIELAKIEKYSIKLGSDNSANEIGIFRTYDKSSSVKYIEDMVKNRLLAVQQKFINYAPEQTDTHSQINTANSGEVRTYGQYIYYIIHPSKDRIFEKIENIFRDENG